jgi:hypothetical protein
MITEFQRKQFIGPVKTQQAGALQTGFEAGVDAWYTVMELHEIEEHCYNIEIPKQSTHIGT